jgi:arsenical pump membrane protein
MCALVANVGSLVLPISNLTNILFADAFRLTFAAFAARMVAPQAVALLTTYALLRWHFRRELPSRCDDATLAEPASVVPNRAYFAACVSVLVVVLLGYFLAPLAGIEPYTVALVGCAVLAVAGVVTGRVGIHAASELSWGVFPFVVGLFIAVRGIENLGVVGASSAWLAKMRPGSPETLIAAAAATAIASNVVNNLPAALIARRVLVDSHAHMGTVLAALIGADVGPVITPFGSLATMLVLALARRAGDGVPTRRFVMLGLWTAPVIVVATTLALILALTSFGGAK